MTKLRFSALTLILLCTKCSFGQTDSTLSSTKLLTSILDTLTVVHVPDTIIVIGVGDVMLGTNYPSSRYLPPADANMLSEVIPLLGGADIRFANLEGTIVDKGGRAKSCKDPTKCYVFRMPENYAPYLVDAGFDMLSLANNHSGDFGTTGRKRTAYILDSLGIKFAGHQSSPYTLIEKDGVKYGMCAFSPNTGTVKINDYNRAREIVSHLDSICDIVIVSFHGGAEGPNHNRVTRKSEYYLGEHRGNVHEFSHLVVDCGADIVFGHGPHIVRAIEIYNNRLIAYSLGNFCTYARFNLTGTRGYAPICEVKLRADGSFIKGRIISCLQQGEGGPKLDENQKAAKEIERLTKMDFPDCPIIFEESGNFYLEELDE